MALSFISTRSKTISRAADRLWIVGMPMIVGQQPITIGHHFVSILDEYFNATWSLAIHGIYVCIHTRMHACIHTSIHPYIHTSNHPYIHTSIHPSVHTYIHTYIHTSIRTYIRTYIHTYIHTQIRYIYIYILTHLSKPAISFNLHLLKPSNNQPLCRSRVSAKVPGAPGR